MTDDLEMQPAAIYEVKAALDGLGRAFEEFKATNDLGFRPDVVTDEKLDRLNGQMSALEKKLDHMYLAARRPSRIGSRALSPEAQERKQAFLDRFVRKGLEQGLEAFELKTLQEGVSGDGGYAVPPEIDRQIDSLLRQTSPIRSIANVVQTGSATYKKLVTSAGFGTGWVGEAAARPATTTPTFNEVQPPSGELYANPAATQFMLDDAMFDVEEWLATEIATDFAAQEGAAFVNGDGTNKPKGFLTYATATTTDATRPFGTVQYVPSGAAGAFAATNPSDQLVDLVHALKAGYRPGANFVMNSSTLAKIRKFKDADGQYIWKPGLVEGASATLLGFGLVEAADMPDVAANTLSIAFGNFQKAYTITDRMGTRVLRDPYSNKPYVHFYTTRRVGGALTNSEALKVMKFAAS